MKITTVITVMCSILSTALYADNISASKKPITAAHVSTPITIDGKINESAWTACTPVSHFLQRDPIQGAASTEKTEVRILFDETALYIGAIMYDSCPDSILSQMGRRDTRLVSDDFTVYLDPYNDERSGFFFTITPSGCIGDGTLQNDDWENDSWDGVWDSEARRTDQGWSAEIKIPYSQLRFHQKENYVWGINFGRTIQRKNERAFIVYTPKDGSGFVSLFPDLYGIKNIKTARKIEILPYFSTKAEYTDQPAGNPFNDGSLYTPTMGANIKVGIGNNLTLDGTINPDFGQVEVDPAVVNLSDVETFYREKRPFFVEGSNIFSFGEGGSSNNFNINWGHPNFFYSRRIGRTPQGSLGEYDFASRPDGARILGAAKLSGKMIGNWNVGTLHAITGRTMANLELEGVQSKQEIEPQTYYGMLRTQKEFNDSRQGLGLIGTFTNRNFDDPLLTDQLNSRSSALAMDGWIFLNNNKDWVLSGWLGMSNIQGSRERILDLQTSSSHYFQRPDADYVKIDTNATSLQGYSGRFSLNKQNGNMIVNAAIGFIDPGFDVNDMGYIRRTDMINSHFIIGNKWINPGKHIRYKELHLAAFGNFNFAGINNSNGLLQFGIVSFLNYWSINWMAVIDGSAYSNTLTRGGPLMETPGALMLNAGFNSDSRKAIGFGLSGNVLKGAADDDLSISPEFNWKPSPGLSLNIAPSYSKSRSKAQWVGAFADETAIATFGKRYVFGAIDQTTLSASIRLNWTFSPTLSLQLYAQPMIASGSYSRFKELAAPKSFDFLIYGEDGSTFSAETYIADPDDAGPAAPIQLSDPDFNFKSLRGNAVLRWEYRPGSTLYFVWTQRRSDFENVGTFRFNNSVERLWRVKPDNIFMVKATYWFTI